MASAAGATTAPPWADCAAPSDHILAETPHVLALRDADALPELLRREAADPAALVERQRNLMRWLSEYKRTTRERMIDTARRMRPPVPKQ